MAKQPKEGFIVHPKWTGDNMFHASYGKNLNRTMKSFRTYDAAVRYLRNNGVGRALYENSTGNTRYVTVSGNTGGTQRTKKGMPKYRRPRA